MFLDCRPLNNHQNHGPRFTLSLWFRVPQIHINLIHIGLIRGLLRVGIFLDASSVQLLEICVSEASADQHPGKSPDVLGSGVLQTSEG